MGNWVSPHSETSAVHTALILALEGQRQARGQLGQQSEFQAGQDDSSSTHGIWDDVAGRILEILSLGVNCKWASGEGKGYHCHQEGRRLQSLCHHKCVTLAGASLDGWGQMRESMAALGAGDAEKFCPQILLQQKCSQMRNKSNKTANARRGHLLSGELSWPSSICRPWPCGAEDERCSLGGAGSRFRAVLLALSAG